MWIRALSLVTSVAMAGCAPTPIVDRSNFDDKAGTQPLVGQLAEAPPGSVMFSQYSYWHRTGAVFTDSNRQVFGEGALFVGAGDTVYPAMIGNDAVYCSEKLLYVDPLVGFYKTACFSDDNADGYFDHVRVAPESTWIERKLSPPLGYKKKDIVVSHGGAFRYELAYQGFSNGTLNLSYREFKGKDLDRPVLTQDVSYQIKEFPAVISFRDAKIEVQEANNDKIIYKILRGF
ncbi:MAG TPA: hypothetical protein VNL74_05120 [Methylococcus sp.]|nr:hypothetical protein [Methylococcus sp.]